MKSRCGWLLTAGLFLAGCNGLPFGRHPAPAQTLMKSLHGEVVYHFSRSLPPDAYLMVMLSDISKKQDASARIIASERIAPIGPSPVSFVLSYEPGDLAGDTDISVTASIKQGDRTLASCDTQTRVLGTSGQNGPVRLRISE